VSLLIILSHLHGRVKADGGGEAGEHRRSRRRHGRDDAEDAGGSGLLGLHYLRNMTSRSSLGHWLIFHDSAAREGPRVRSFVPLSNESITRPARNERLPC